MLPVMHLRLVPTLTGCQRSVPAVPVTARRSERQLSAVPVTGLATRPRHRFPGSSAIIAPALADVFCDSCKGTAKWVLLPHGCHWPTISVPLSIQPGSVFWNHHYRLVPGRTHVCRGHPGCRLPVLLPGNVQWFCPACWRISPGPFRRRPSRLRSKPADLFPIA